jgi:outer membrane protein OmpA-like peptidoglycan-associated protein/tetratricopeptide (TPR) repeat protein
MKNNTKDLLRNIFPNKQRLKKMLRLPYFPVVLIFLVLNQANAFSQKYSTKSSKAIKKFTQALDYYQQYQYSAAMTEAKSALKADSVFLEAYYLLSDIYGQTGDTGEKIRILRKAVSINSEYSNFAYLNLGRAELSVGQYFEAKTHLLEFEKRNKISEYTGELKKLIHSADFGIDALAKPVDFKPQNLGPAINTKYDEYHPSMTADEQTLIFTVGLPRPGIDTVIVQTDTQEDIFISRKDSSGLWAKAVQFGAPLNTNRNEGAHSVTADGSVLYFTACEDASGYNPHGLCLGRCDIYKTVRNGNQWLQPENCGPIINTKYKETQPNISPDGHSLYFVSDRPGGFGGLDIWRSSLSENGLWSKPVNLGDSVNTAADDVSPFVAADCRTLYFSSSGWEGLGRSDIFFSHKNADKSWSKAINLGFPINTYGEQTGLTLNTAGNRAYYAADYKGGYGRQDIYEFEMPEKLRPHASVYVTGIVYDSITKVRLLADFDLISLQTKDTLYRSNSNAQTGKFILILPLGEDYALNINKKGYLFASENFTLSSTEDSLFVKFLNIALLPIQNDASVVLKNIFFEFDKYELKPESSTELQKLYDFLQTNASLKIEIGGHTDNVGSKAHNNELSDMRAKAVYDDLIRRGIDKNRLSFKGYADKKPIASNNTPEGRATNRRTEFRVLK